jgi:hypothetical protein
MYIWAFFVTLMLGWQVSDQDKEELATQVRQLREYYPLLWGNPLPKTETEVVVGMTDQFHQVTVDPCSNYHASSTDSRTEVRDMHFNMQPQIQIGCKNKGEEIPSMAALFKIINGEEIEIDMKKNIPVWLTAIGLVFGVLTACTLFLTNFGM